MLRKTSIAIAISIALAAAGSASSASASSVLRKTPLLTSVAFQEQIEDVSTSTENVLVCFPIPYTPWRICF